MVFLSRFRSLLRNLVQDGRVERELSDEVSSYTELLVEGKMKQGMSERNARRAARLEMGGPSQVEEAVRCIHAGAWLRTCWLDLRHGARVLRNRPGFTAVAVLTFAIGIGANTTIFSMVNGSLFRPLGVQRPDRMVYLVEKHEYWGNTFSYPDFEDIRRQSGDCFADLAAMEPFEVEGLSVDGRTQTIWTAYVTTNFFSMMGVQPALGSVIVPEKDRLPGSEPALVVSYAFWETHLGGDPAIVGKKATINGHAVTIIGVAAKGYHGITSLVETQGFLPLWLAETVQDSASSSLLGNREQRHVFIFGRLRDGTGIAQAQSALSVIANRLANEYPKIHKDLAFRPISAESGFINSTGENPMPLVAALFLTLAGLVLALAAANVANLLLVRALARNREMAVRLALGAARGRLVRQVLTETLLLALLGCAGGVLLGMGGSRAVSSIPLQTDFPFIFDFPFDWRVFSYALAAAVAVAMISGLVPAWRTSGVDLNDALGDSARGSTGRRQRLHSVLVVGQVAGSLMLLIVAGLFVRSLRVVQQTNLGFDPNQVMNFTLDVHQAGYNESRGRAFYDQLLVRAQSLPGVKSASLAQVVPLGIFDKGTEIKIPGYQQPDGQPKPGASFCAVSPAYFDVLRMPVIRGRGFLDSDNAGAPHVAIINDAMWERYWPGQEPIGKQFTQLDDPDHVQQVVGVVRNSRTAEITGPIGPFFYMPIAQNYTSLQTLQVRAETAAASSAMAKPVLELIHSPEPTLPVGDVESMNQALNGANGFLLYRLGATIAAGLGLLGLALAILGVYGVVSYSAAQRTHEIGIRMALGAEPGQVIGTIFRQGLTIVGIGILLGLLAAAGIAKLAGSFLVGVSAIDPLTFVSVSMLLAAIALLACYIPARRATRVDPMIALRYE